jgi:hypothetical protein
MITDSSRSGSYLDMLSQLERKYCQLDSNSSDFFFFKVWWQDATLFVYFSYFITYLHSFIHSITFIKYIYPFSFSEASLHFLIACLLSGETPPCGAESRIELGPALQQADALPTEPCFLVRYRYQLKPKNQGFGSALMRTQIRILSLQLIKLLGNFLSNYFLSPLYCNLDENPYT